MAGGTALKKWKIEFLKYSFTSGFTYGEVAERLKAAAC
jgi:hypothetical protein